MRDARNKTNLMKKKIILLCLVFLAACAPKEKAHSTSELTDSAAIAGEKENIQVEPTGKTPIDTIVVSKGKLYIAILEYTDFNPDKSIGNFEVKEVETNHTIFRSNSLRFYSEVIYRTGEVDDISIVPAYKIISKYPFEMGLTFNFEGDLSIDYFEDLIGNVTYDTAFLRENLSRMHFNFLNYKFTNDNDWKVKSHLQFVPKKCEVSNEKLLNEFKKFKNDLNFYNGTELAKLAFICFLNGENPQYKSMMDQFKKSIVKSNAIHDSYPYIEYLDHFIFNLNPQ